MYVICQKKRINFITEIINIHLQAGKDGKLPNVCSYLVSSETAAFDPTPFPELNNGKMGPTDAGRDLGMKPLSHPSPYFVAPESGEVDIVFSTIKPLDLSTHLELQTEDGKVGKDRFVFTTQEDGKVTFKVSFPEAGVYGFKIFAKEQGAETLLDNVYNYVIDAKTPKPNCKPFPKPFNAWTNGCLLIDPKEGMLPANQSIHFKVKVPDVNRVAVIGTKVCKHKPNNYIYWK